MKVTTKWLKNNGLRITRRNGGARSVTRFVGPNDQLSILEAAKALGTYYELIRRMVQKGQIQTVATRRACREIPMAEVLRLKRAWKITGRPTRLIAS